LNSYPIGTDTLTCKYHPRASAIRHPGLANPTLMSVLV